MKKIIALGLVLASMLGLCACQKNPETAQSADATTTAPTTEFVLPSGIMQKYDPTEDDTFNLLLVGSSGSYYYVEELQGMLEAAGIKARVCNIYYSGCLLSQHYNWWKNNEANYEFFTTDENGRSKEENVSLEYCMQQRNWDAICLSESGTGKLRVGEAQTLLKERETYLTELYAYFRQEFPLSDMLWQENGAYEKGYSKGFTIETTEQQAEDTRHFREFSIAIAEKYNVTWVPRGEASQIYRETPGVEDNLTARLGVNNDKGDQYHDGDIGGGQYLTACAWFEVLTGQSCIGNTWRPNYTLSEEKIQLLQECAHKAVENWRTGNFG